MKKGILSKWTQVTREDSNFTMWQSRLQLKPVRNDREGRCILTKKYKQQKQQEVCKLMEDEQLTTGWRVGQDRNQDIDLKF